MPVRARPTPQGLLVLASLPGSPLGDLTKAADGVRGTSPVSRDPAEESRSQERSEKAASHLRFLEPNHPPASPALP